MSRYLITGGAGFIGRHLCRRLAEAGNEVRVFDSLVEQAHGAATPAAVPGATEFIHADLRDPDAVARSLRGVDGVFHLAAEVGVGQSMYEIARYVAGNDLGTAVLMEQLVKSHVHRIVVSSSMSIYGEGRYVTGDGRIVDDAQRSRHLARPGCWDPVGPDGEVLRPVPTDETKRPDLASVYALTKYTQERLTLMLAAAYGIEAVGLRLFNVFGVGQALSNPYTGVLAIFAGRLLNGQPPLIFEDGRQQRDFVHVDDVARAFHLAMETPGVSGEVFNIASGRAYTVERVAHLLAEAMGRADLRPQILEKARIGDVRHCLADVSKASRQLGFEPRHSLDTAVHELVDWVSRQQASDRVPQARKELEERGLVV